MNSAEKIVEGMKLIKEGCSEVPVGAYNYGKSTCPFGWLCYGEPIDPQWIGTFPHRRVNERNKKNESFC